MRTAHIVCYHGLGDAVRFALPLACAYAKGGWQAILHIRADLVPAIGLSKGIDIAAVADEFFRQFDTTQAAMDAYAGLIQADDKVVILGASAVDHRLVDTLMRRGQNCHDWYNDIFIPDRLAGTHEPEIFKTTGVLLGHHGFAPLEKSEWAPSPMPQCRAHEFRNSPKPLVGVHCTALWPARCYPHYQAVIAQLSKQFTVWNFDDAPCDNLGRLAWIIKDSIAVLSVDTFILHLANALSVPVLNLQGPVWQHPEHAPYTVKGTPTTPAPVTVEQIDKQDTALSRLDPQDVAQQFQRFVYTGNRSEWLSHTHCAKYLQPDSQ